MRVLVILASTRPGRLAPAVAEWFVHTTDAYLAGERVRVDVADLAEIGLPFLDEPEHPSGGIYRHEHTRAWSRRVAAADAFVIVTPEYNYGMPAALKNALDFLYQEWAWKPVAFISYGNTSAGTRSVQMTKQVVTTLRMMPIGATIALRVADSIQDGQVRHDAALDEAAHRVVVELTRVARVVRPLRMGTEQTAEPAPSGGLTLAPAEEADLAELLVLQRCCWVQEALANQTLDLAPLRETLADVRAWVDSWQVWCARRHNRLVAAVRARSHGSVWEIGRLMVAPDQAGNGIGSWLLDYAEQHADDTATDAALFTGRHSQRNIDLYQRAGYTLSPLPAGSATGDAVYLTKRLHRHASRELLSSEQS